MEADQNKDGRYGIFVVREKQTGIWYIMEVTSYDYTVYDHHRSIVDTSQADSWSELDFAIHSKYRVYAKLTT